MFFHITLIKMFVFFYYSNMHMEGNVLNCCENNISIKKNISPKIGSNFLFHTKYDKKEK